MGILDLLESVAWNIGNQVEKVRDKVEDIGLDIESKIIETQVNAEFMANDLKDLSHDIVELKQNLADIAVSGMTKGHEVECSSDIREESDEIIKRANEEYFTQYQKIKDALAEVDKEWAFLYDEKVQVAKRLKYHYDEDITIPLKVPMCNIIIPQGTERDYYDDIFDTIFPDLISITPIKVILKWTIASQRLEEAKKYRKEAVRYEADIRLKMSKMDMCNSYIEQMKAILSEEKQLLDLLKQFINSENKIRHHEIAAAIEKLLSEMLLDEKGHINQKYGRAVEDLKNLLEI